LEGRSHREGSAAALVAALGIVLSLWMASAGPANAITIGTNDTNNFIPFGGLSTELAPQLSDPAVVPQYQQVYNQDAFADSLTITELKFFEFDPPGQVGSALLGGTFTIRLSTTTRSMNALACCDNILLNTNRGADEVEFIVDAVLADNYLDGTLTFSATTPFSYDPSLGNLLIDIQVGGYDPDNAVAELVLGTRKFFQLTDDTIGGGDPLVSLASNWDGFNNQGIGLVTVLVPEPSTFFLMSSGLLVLGLLPRRRGAAR
jgi:hypothetical protein